jgi:para-aminobenzoate synthetase/4-amino-4-deoxychorismate lyase
MTADEVAGLPCRLVVRDLGCGPLPEVMLRRLAAEPGVACLWGRGWGGVLLMSRPLVVASTLRALDAVPALESEVGRPGFSAASDAIGASDAVGGGWVGWVDYAGAARFGFYDHLLHWDESTRRWRFEALVSAGRVEQLRAREAMLRGLLGAGGGTPAAGDASGTDSSWWAGTFDGADQPDHLRAVERAIGLIRDGQLYQANVCTRLAAPFGGSPAGLFAAAASSLNPAYGAFVDGAERAVASFSPELFLRRDGRQLTSSPIKGTRPRAELTGVVHAATPADDGARQLRGSAKDAAENVMIVDLMRNDLGRVCVPGSIRVPDLLRIEAHPGVWHLVSTVTGRLRPDVGDGELLASAFPPGSVTGAPKHRAIQVIAALESSERGVYTGAIGFVSPVAGLRFNVAIRTFEIGGGRIELGVGGGVTADSVPMAEWRECLQKATPLLAALGAGVTRSLARPAPRPSAGQLAGGLLETMLAVDGRVLRLADHLSRLDLSCRELYGMPLPAEATALVRAALVRESAGSGRLALRLVLAPPRAAPGELPAGPQLRVSVSVAPVPPARSRLRTVGRAGGLWRHKWAQRSGFSAAEQAGAPRFDAPLFVAADGTALETSRGNLFLIQDDGALVTPPLRDDLLPGVTRRAVLDLARGDGREVELRAFGVPELHRAACVFWTSSLSGAVPVVEVDGVALRCQVPVPTELAARLELGTG